ncbi:hypothetical protein PC128_g17719 [Phytophthora cactorum]|nr:hypothetical protein PC128_g17719 [Phytophthora cactorum]
MWKGRQGAGNFLRDLEDGAIELVCLITGADSASLEVNTVSGRPKNAELKPAREERFGAQFWEEFRRSGSAVYDTAHEYADVFQDKIPAELPAERGICHKIDLAPGSKYCVTRQWSLPRDQGKAIDNFFKSCRKQRHVRESITPPSGPTFCVM